MMVPTPDDVLLGLLAAQPQHGYQLLDWFRNPAWLGSVWSLSTSQLYAVLKRLERDGLIEGKRLPSLDAPPRTEFTLTDAGRQRLDGWLYEPHPAAEVPQVRVDFLSRLTIARLLSQPTEPIARAQKAACRAQRAMLMADRSRAAPGMEWLSREFHIAQLDAVLDWIDRCELTPKGVEADE